MGLERSLSTLTTQKTFSNVGTVAIDRRVLYKYDQNGCAQASRTQFPLTPCYATTVHKGHTPTLDAIDLHCSQEFVSGQTYVAI